MSTIKLQKCLGEAPSVSKRALGENAAVASDLYAKSNEFIPLRNDLAVTSISVSPAKTLYRIERLQGGELNTDVTLSETWIGSTDRRSYVKGQISDDATARTYYTIDDSDAPPRVFDNTPLSDKPLGIPAPTTKPTVKLIASDEFTENDFYDLVKIKLAQVAYAIRANAPYKVLGMAEGFTGYLSGPFDPVPVGVVTDPNTGTTAGVNPGSGVSPIVVDDSGITVVGASVPAASTPLDPIYAAKVEAITTLFNANQATPTACVASLQAAGYTYNDVFDALVTTSAYNFAYYLQVNYLPNNTYGRRIWPASEINAYYTWWEANHDMTYRGMMTLPPVDRTNPGAIWTAAQYITGAQDAIDAGANAATAAPWRF